MVDALAVFGFAGLAPAASDFFATASVESGFGFSGAAFAAALDSGLAATADLVLGAGFASAFVPAFGAALTVVLSPVLPAVLLPAFFAEGLDSVLDAESPSGLVTGLAAGLAAALEAGLVAGSAAGLAVVFSELFFAGFAEAFLTVASAGGSCFNFSFAFGDTLGAIVDGASDSVLDFFPDIRDQKDPAFAFGSFNGAPSGDGFETEPSVVEDLSVFDFAAILGTPFLNRRFSLWTY